MDLTNPAPLSLSTLVINLLLGLGLSLLLAWYYKENGLSLSNRSKFALNIPMLTLITLLVISIVKSSLALSLGLVGALSIVRFRTAIKDPEELVYLFFAIAIGLGMGADQRVPTLAAFGIIMGYLLIRHLLGQKLVLRPGNSLYLNVSFQSLEERAAGVFENLNSVLIKNFNEVDLHRMDVERTETQFVFYLRAESPASLVRFTNDIQEMYPQVKISIVEQRNLIGG